MKIRIGGFSLLPVVITGVVMGLTGCSASRETMSRIGPPFMKGWEAQKAEQHGKCVEHFTQSIKVSQGEAARGRQSGADGQQAYVYALEYLSFGHSGRAQCLKALGRTQEAKSDFEKCAEVSTQALDQGKNISGWSGSHRGTVYKGRALAIKELGQLPEAIADMEAGVKLQNVHCHSGSQDSVCRQVADDMETLAKWKKELAAQGGERR